MTHPKPRFITKITTAVLFMTAFALGIYAQNTTSSPENTPEKTLALKLIAAKTDDERSLLLANEVGLVNSNLVGALTDEAARQNGHAPYMELQRISRIGLTIAEQLGDKREIARALYSLGLTQQTDDEKRITFAKGLMISEEIRDDEFTAKNLMRLAPFNDLDVQVEYYRRSIAIAEKIGDMRTTADALGGLGGVYRLKGDFDAARNYLSKSLAVMRQLNDANGVANLISAIGVVSFRQGDLNTALEEYKKSLQMHESIGNKDGVSVDAFRIGNIYLAFGDNVQAMTWYLKSLKVGEEVGSGLGTFGATLNMVNVYNAQGNYQQARAYLKKVAGTTNENEYPWYALSGLAESYKVEGNNPEAIRFYLNLLARKEKEVNKDEIAQTLVDIGNCYLLIPDATKAEQYFERARTLSESTGHYLWRFQALIGIAKTQLIRKEFRGALDNANRAKAFIEKLKGTPELDLYTTLGRAYAELGQPQPARIHFEKAISIVESLRTRVAGGSVEQQGDFQNKIIPYEMMADLMVSAGSNNEAFEIVEQAKARTLLDNLENGSVNIDKQLTEKESSTEHSVRYELVSLSKQIEIENGKPQPEVARVAALQDQLAKKRLQFEDFQNRLYVEHPDLKVQRGEMRSIGLDEAGALLPDAKSAFLEFMVADDKAFAFVITKDVFGKPTLRAFPIDIKQKDLAAQVEKYRSTLAAGDLDFRKQSRELYDLLLKPADTQLAGKTNFIIVPDGTLWDLPFQALQNGQNKYLVEQAAVSYAPSLTALREMSKKATNRKLSGDTELLAFGNPIVGKETKERVQRVFMSEKLEPLPESERLVNELGRMYGANRSNIFTGNDAREETAKTESAKYRIVQFATHGILNNASPMYSHLVLSQKADNPIEDGLLEAWEMKDLNLKADMVILSACETARGRISNGEGVIGMTWAMFIAGTPTTVASQWKVESSSTTELMLEFHRQLLTGKTSKAEALRRASLKLMKSGKYQHPSYWAGWVLVGDGN